MDFSQLSDEALIIQHRHSEPGQRNPKLLSELVKRYQDQVVQRCRFHLKDADAAWDTSQEVWIRVLEKLPQFNAEVKFPPWLFTIVHNRCYDHLHQNKQQHPQSLSRKIIDTLEELNTEDIIVPTGEILEELREKLTGEEKLLLKVKYEYGWSVKAIQQSLGISESGVKMRLLRVREKMQKLLKEYQASHDSDGR